MKHKIIIIFLLAFICSATQAQNIFNWGKPKVEEPCSVYWNGRAFKLGSTKGDSNFTRIAYEYYGVEAVIVSLPVAMASELGAKAKVGEEVPIAGKFKVFADTHWDEISKLCKLEKLK